jgi:hypothetical protein
MHPDDLKTVWLCCECGRNFLFHSDVDDHKKQFSHPTVILCNIPETSKSPTFFVRGRISIGFRLDRERSNVVIEYQYYPYTGAIDYLDVKYTDTRLQSKVERNPHMMTKIDNYLRKVLNARSTSLLKRVHAF